MRKTTFIQFYFLLLSLLGCNNVLSVLNIMEAHTPNEGIQSAGDHISKKVELPFKKVTRAKKITNSISWLFNSVQAAFYRDYYYKVIESNERLKAEELKEKRPNPEKIKNCDWQIKEAGRRLAELSVRKAPLQQSSKIFPISSDNGIKEQPDNQHAGNNINLQEDGNVTTMKEGLLTLKKSTRKGVSLSKSGRE